MMTQRIDRIVTNRVLALPIFAGVIFVVYWLSISTVGGAATDWLNEVFFGEMVPAQVTAWLLALGCADWLLALIVDGVIAGVGAVLGFLPQLMLLFLCLAWLEQCGYMARIAVVMDKLFRRFGLNGQSFMSMVIATGCAVPAIMAARSIADDRDRRITVMVTSFMPCGAKLAIIALIAGALFGGTAWIAVSAYFVGIGAIVISGVILKKLSGSGSEPAAFAPELPDYSWPKPGPVLYEMWDRSRHFVIKAGTVILVACIIIWFLSNFNWQLDMVASEEHSILAAIGNLLAPLFTPLGWGDWKATVATLTGLFAKENVVGSLGVLYGFESAGATSWAMLQAAYTKLAAYSFLVFNLLCAPCFATIGAIHSEMGSARWTTLAIGYQTALAYTLALIIYQLGMLCTGAGFGIGSAVAIALTLLLLYLLLRPQRTTSSASGRHAA